MANLTTTRTFTLTNCMSARYRATFNIHTYIYINWWKWNYKGHRCGYHCNYLWVLIKNFFRLTKWKIHCISSFFFIIVNNNTYTFLPLQFSVEFFFLTFFPILVIMLAIFKFVCKTKETDKHIEMFVCTIVSSCREIFTQNWLISFTNAGLFVSERRNKT